LLTGDDMRTANAPGFDLQLAGGTDPEGLVPEQWEERLRAPATPELRLMAAVLIDAIRDYRNGARARGVRPRQLARLAARWIASREPAWVFSFENICAVFDLDADRLRRRLARERAYGADAPQRQSRRNLILTGTPGRAARRRDVLTLSDDELPESQVA
jgi:hypothetical protein